MQGLETWAHTHTHIHTYTCTQIYTYTLLNYLFTAITYAKHPA